MPGFFLEIDEDVASKAKLAAATVARAAAFGPPYEANLSFKSAVRAGLGASSPAYRRPVFQERPPAAPVEA